MTPSDRPLEQSVRAWLQERYGTDYGVSGDQLRALIERAEAKRLALGYGSVYVMVANWIREPQ